MGEVFVDLLHLFLPVLGVGDQEEVLFLPALEDVFDLASVLEVHRLLVGRRTRKHADHLRVQFGCVHC